MTLCLSNLNAEAVLAKSFTGIVGKECVEKEPGVVRRMSAHYGNGVSDRVMGFSRKHSGYGNGAAERGVGGVDNT